MQSKDQLTASQIKVLTVLLPVLAILLAFQNCAETEFSQIPSSKTQQDGSDTGQDNAGQDIDPGLVENPDDQDNTTNPKAPDKDPVVIVRNCETLRERDALQSLETVITFHDTKEETGRNNVCNWGQDGNLGYDPNDRSRYNNFQVARYEQIRSISLPDNAELCDLNLLMDKQTLRYDDMFYMTLNGYVIASNTSSTTTSALETDYIELTNGDLIPTYKYLWEDIVEEPFNNAGGDDYCLGSDGGLASCTWPDTQKTGDFIFEYDPELLINLGAKSPNNNQDIGFSVTGDNDPKSDCYHEEFSFSVTATYYVKE